jgi:hypothetical protein
MANTKRVQLRKGTENEHAAFTGALAEVTYDTTKSLLRVHDGTTTSGIEIRNSRLTEISSATDLRTNIKYFTDTSNAPFTVTLPSLKYVGDVIQLADSKYYWSINNLTVNTQSGEQIKDSTGYVDAPLVCDVSGETIELIWEGTYWRLF